MEQHNHASCSRWSAVLSPAVRHSRKRKDCSRSGSHPHALCSSHGGAPVFARDGAHHCRPIPPSPPADARGTPTVANPQARPHLLAATGISRKAWDSKQIGLGRAQLVLEV